LDGDHVICGYHGFRYDAEGECIEVPSSDKCPKGIGVQHYQLVETGPLIWIWMGDPTLADVSKIPVQSWITDSEWTTSFGYYEMQSNYVSVHENLLDLTHLSFVHAKTFGTPDFAKAAYKTEIQDGYFSITRDVVPTLLPPIWGRPTGLEGCTTAARIVKSEFISPALHVTTGTYYDSALPISSRPKFSIKALHVVTPFTSSSCHYFIVFGRDFVKGDNEVTSFMTSSLFAAFDEDKAALAALEKVWLTTEEQEMFEISTAADGPSVSMRRYLKSRADSEANNSMN
jgi:vanillate O-demethylase monooxygenase subunit